jgi:hypothetical protein
VRPPWVESLFNEESESRMRNIVLITLMALGLAGTTPAAHAGTPACGTSGGLTYSFREGDPASSLVIKTLRPKRTSGSVLVGSGTLTLDDATLVPLKITARAGSRQTVLYTFSGAAPTGRVRGRLKFRGCPPELEAVRITISRPRTKRATLEDPAHLVPVATLRPETRMLDETDVGSLRPDPTDPSLLTVASTEPLASSIREGTVLAIGITAGTPEGLLRRVVAVQPGPQMTTFVTEPAVLADAFETLDLSLSSESLAPPSGSAARGAPRAGCTRGICVQEDIGGELDDGDGGKLTFAGSIYADAGYSIELHVDLEDRNLSGHALVFGDVGGDFDLTATKTLEFGDKKEKKLGREIRLPPIQVGGIVLTPKIKFYGGAHGSITGSFGTGVHGKVFAEAGVECANIDSCELIRRFGSEFDGYLNVAAEANARVWVRPQVDLALYDRIALFASLSPFVAFNAHTSADPWWTLRGGIDGNIGLDVHTWWRTYTPFEKNFEVFSFDILDAGGPFGCSPPCARPVIHTDELPHAIAGAHYTAQLEGSGEAPLSWSYGDGGSLPAGLFLTEEGVVQGTSYAPDDVTFDVILTDRFGRTATRAVRIVVEYGPGGVPSPTPLPSPSPTPDPPVPPDPCRTDLPGEIRALNDAGQVLESTFLGGTPYRYSAVIHDLTSGTSIDLTRLVYDTSGAFLAWPSQLNESGQVAGFLRWSGTPPISGVFLVDEVGVHVFPAAPEETWSPVDLNDQGTLIANVCPRAQGGYPYPNPCSVARITATGVSFQTLPFGLVAGSIDDAGNVVLGVPSSLWSNNMSGHPVDSLHYALLSADGTITPLSIPEPGVHSLRIGRDGRLVGLQGATPIVFEVDGSTRALDPAIGDACMVASVASDGSTLVFCASCEAANLCYDGLVPYVYPPGSASWIGGHLASHLPPHVGVIESQFPAGLLAQLNGRGQLLLFYGGRSYFYGNYAVLDLECATQTEGPYPEASRTAFGCSLLCFHT